MGGGGRRSVRGIGKGEYACVSVGDIGQFEPGEDEEKCKGFFIDLLNKRIKEVYGFVYFECCRIGWSVRGQCTGLGSPILSCTVKLQTPLVDLQKK